MAENHELRRARERQPSQVAPGFCMSRQELADQVNLYLHGDAEAKFVADANYIGKLERGIIRWPGDGYRSALREALKVVSDRELGFYPPRRRAATVAPVRRSEFIRTAVYGVGALMAAPLLDLVTPTERTPVPPKASRTEVDQIRIATHTFKSWDNTFGGGLAREAALAQLQWSANLLFSKCDTEDLRRDLFSAVGSLAGVTGFMAFDAYAHGDARRMFRFAVTCADEAKDWHLRAMLLSSMARQAVWCGEADDALTHIEMALVRSDRLTATERAMLSTVRARALAKLGRHKDCLAAVGAADEAFSNSDPAEDPEWMAFYDTAQHHGDTAHALFDLSIRGVHTEAAPRLAFSVANHGDEYARSRAISQTKLATLTMATGDPYEAVAIGKNALSAAGYLRSKRALDDLRELRRTAGRHIAIPDVAELKERISSVVDAA